MQYKPSRWWFEFALLYNKIFFVLLSVLLNSDERAWHLLGSLVAITVATLALVAVDKPFRGKADQDEDTTLGDKLMLVALASQLVNYGVSAVCLQHKEERLGSGLDEMSDEVALFAAVVGFLLVGVQVAGVVYTYLDEKADEKKKANTTDEDKPQKASPKEATAMMNFNNPLNQNTDDRVNDGAVADQARDALAAQALPSLGGRPAGASEG